MVDRIASWRHAWMAVGVAEPDAALLAALLARYAEAQRAYHTLQHLDECLALFEAVSVCAERPGEVALALWFHDAIYDVQGRDNEARSAAWAREALLAAGVDGAAVARVVQLIMATRHDVLPLTVDAKLLVDIDLAILGAEASRFAQYEQQIRQEYAWVAPAVFAAKRAAVLAGFLARPRIYATDALFMRLELPARANLQAAILQLGT